MAHRGVAMSSLHRRSSFCGARPQLLPRGDVTPLPKEMTVPPPIDASQKSFWIDPESPGAHGTIEDLLAEQLVVVEQALLFNQVLTHRLFGYHHKHTLCTASSLSSQQVHASTHSPSSHRANGLAHLTTPLLSYMNNETLQSTRTRSASGSSVASWASASAENPHHGHHRRGHTEAHIITAEEYNQQGHFEVFNTTAAEYLQQGRDDVTSVTAEVYEHQGHFAGTEVMSIVADKPPLSRGKSPRLLHLFPVVEDIKQLVLDTLGERDQDTKQLYDETGCWQMMAQHNYFNNLSLIVILLNTIWIAIDTDCNKAAVLSDAPLIFQVTENCFCTFFVFEMMVRILAFKVRCDAFTDRWLVFDFCLVASMVWETWIIVMWLALFGGYDSVRNGRASSIFRIFRLFRLTRVARTARLVANFPELMILAKGMIIAMRSVAAVLALLGIIIYIFSIVFTELLADSPSGTGIFENVPQSMNTLLLQVLSGFDEDMMKNLMNTDPACYLIFLVYVLIASLTIMNMLIGILCDVVSNVASEEAEDAFVHEVENLVTKLMAELDEDGSGTLSKEEFDGIIMNQDMMHVLRGFGVDVVGIVDFASFLFTECDELSFADFLQLVVQFRESKAATVRDVMDLRKYLARELSSLEARLIPQSRHETVAD